MTKHTNHGHSHCNHCVHLCSPCNEVYCCSCNEKWEKPQRCQLSHYAPWHYHTYPTWTTTPSYVSSAGTHPRGDMTVKTIATNDKVNAYFAKTGTNTEVTSMKLDHSHKHID